MSDNNEAPGGRLTQEIANVIAVKLPEIVSEEVFWDLTMALGPDGSPVIFLFFFMPGAIIGTTVNCTLVMSNPETITVEDVEKVIRTAYEGLQKGRSEQLEGVQRTVAQGNGEGVVEGPASGGMELPQFPG